MIATRRIKLISLALLMSGGATLVTQQWLQGAVERAAQQARATTGPAAPAAGIRVLVAAAALPAGTILKPGDLRWQTWPQGPTGGYLTSETIQIEQVAGSVLRGAVAVGEPITAGELARPGERGVLSAVLRPGFRAVTINVTAASGVAGFVMPGDQVDLILSRLIESQGSGPKRFVSETVLTDLRVLGVDQRGQDGKNEVATRQTTTLEVTPEGAEVIAVVAELGKLSMSLRSLAAPDTELAARAPVTRTWDNEATQSAPAPGPRPVRSAARAAEPAVEIIRGSQ